MSRYPLRTVLEVMDRDRIDRMRVGTVTATVGDRIHITYAVEPKPLDTGKSRSRLARKTCLQLYYKLIGSILLAVQDSGLTSSQTKFILLGLVEQLTKKYLACPSQLGSRHLVQITSPSILRSLYFRGGKCLKQDIRGSPILSAWPPFYVS